MKRHGVTELPESRWTRPEDYLGPWPASGHSGADAGCGTAPQPESPQLLLSTIPFLVLISLLGVLGVAIMFIALPGGHQQPAAVPVAHRELGVAPKGWFQEAQREFHH